MVVTNENLIEMLKKVVEILQIEDKEKVTLAVDILSLIINYIGAENIMISIESGLENVMERISDIVTGDNFELSTEERLIKLAATRDTLDDLFDKIAFLETIKKSECPVSAP